MSPLIANAFPTEALLAAAVAGLIASLACGLGALPLGLRQIDPARHAGLGFAVAGGLMIAASVFSLIVPGLEMETAPGSTDGNLLRMIGGLLVGAAFLSVVERYLPEDSHDANGDERFVDWGGRVGLLIFVAMCAHSIPEGIAVGVGYTSDEVLETSTKLGTPLAIAIGIHNIPEGLAVAIPMRSRGVSIARCFWAAVITSLPQPLAAVPAVLLAWFFQPLMPVLMGFAAGAMVYLVVVELIPQALAKERPNRIAWAFMLGFCGMIVIQKLL